MSSSIRVKVKSQESLKVKSSISGKNTSELDDVDLSNLQDGSVLVYSTESGKWESTILLEKQIMNAGHF